MEPVEIIIGAVVATAVAAAASLAINATCTLVGWVASRAADAITEVGSSPR